MRRGPNDVYGARQRTLFGVDRLERLVADMVSEMLCLIAERDTRLGVSRETAHTQRMKSWLIQYIELQRSDFELGNEENSDGTSEK